MNAAVVIRWLSMAAGATAVMVVLATAYQAAAGPVDTNPPGNGSVDQGQVGDPAAPGADEQNPDDPDPNDPEVQDAEIQDLEVQDLEVQDPDRNDPDPVDDPDPDDPGGAVPGAGDPDDPDPDDPDPDDPEIQDPELQQLEVQDPEIDDPDPGGLTCPPGYAAGPLVLNAPGGQITLFTCIAE